MFLDTDQLQTAILTVLVATAVAGALVFHRGAHRVAVRRWGGRLLCVCAVAALASWMNFGVFDVVFVDAPGVVPAAPGRKKIERHLPFHFHENFHYYIGSKYFGDFGYEGLYDCTALADAENAAEQGVHPRINGYVRDLDDVLRDKTYDEAKAHCHDEILPGVKPARWAKFKSDLRELQTIVPDDWWNSVVFDAGFNPPPSWVVVGGAISNSIPIRAAGLPTFLVSTSLDMLLLVACFIAVRRAFGTAAAATAAIFFGATFIASYGWNGGAFLRYTWLASVIFALVALRFGRWALAGAFFAAAACDRIFPLGFAVGAVLPLAFRALKSPEDRRRLMRFGAGFAGTAAVLVLLSLVFFGWSPWRVFFSRILRHGDVYYVMHIGLKKVLNWGRWVPSQDFRWHHGLQNFHDWNLKLHANWASMRAIVVPVQLAAAGAAALASLRRRPYESALICGVFAMFFFNIPANYYYVVLVMVPALLLRAGITAPTIGRRLREYTALTGFVLFWMTTLLASRLSGDDIVYNHIICVWLMMFLVAWVALWMWPRRLDRAYAFLRDALQSWRSRRAATAAEADVQRA
jgi:hypothetical protein